MEDINYLRFLIERGNKTDIRKVFDNKQTTVLTAIPGKFQANRLETDTISQLLLPAPFQHLKEVQTTGDGNCLYHAVSIGISGNESLSADLRLLCAADLFLNSPMYSRCKTFETDDNFGMSISGSSENIFIRTKSRIAALENEALLTCKVTPRPEWSSLIYMSVLSNILKRPIQSLYPDNTGFHYQELYNQRFEPLSVDQIVTDPLYILWSVDGTLPHGVFTPNHFVAILPDIEDNTNSPSQRTKSDSEHVPKSFEMKTASTSRTVEYNSRPKLFKQSHKTLFDYNFSSSPNTSETSTGGMTKECDEQNGVNQRKSSFQYDKSCVNGNQLTSPIQVDNRNKDIARNINFNGKGAQGSKSKIQESVIEIPEKNQPRYYKFPPRYFGKAKPCKRHFRSEWFDLFKWLHYSEDEDRAFCHNCMRAHARNLITDSTEKAFTSIGFINWKDAIRAFTQHEHSESHKEAVVRLNISNECADVIKALRSKSDGELEFNRKALVKLISNLRFLARQELPIRGAWDDSISNFTQTNLLRGEDDPNFLNWLNKKYFVSTPPRFKMKFLI